MKKLIVFAILLIGMQINSNAQHFEWGIKGGFNYNSNGDIIDKTGDIIATPEANAGFNIGFFGKTKGRIYIRPELLYTQTNSNYNNGGESTKLTIQKIDAPILLGIKLIGPLHFVIGPSFQYIINTDLKDFNLSNVEKEITVGGTIGISVQIFKLGIDLRYERGFTSNEASFLNVDKIANIDTRPNQLIAGLSFKFN